MRSAISVLGVLAALLLVGACFDPTRTCSTDADCVNGGNVRPRDEDLRRGGESERQDSAGVLDRGDAATAPAGHGEAHRVRPGLSGRRSRRVPPGRERGGDGHLARSGRGCGIGESAGPRCRYQSGDGCRGAAGSMCRVESGRVESVLPGGDSSAGAASVRGVPGGGSAGGLGGGPQQQRRKCGCWGERDAVEVAVLGGGADLHDAGDCGRWDDRVRDERWRERERVRAHGRRK